MVYARKNRMRKNLRNNRVLSTKRIFNNKSAKSQASQIWALRKRINRVYQRTKPEYKLLRSDVKSLSFGYNSVNSSYPNLLNNFSGFFALPQSGTGDNQRIGNKITMFPVNIFMNLKYNEINQILSNVYPYVHSELPTHGMMLRFVAIQQISASSDSPQYDQIFKDIEVGENVSVESSLMNMTAPFVNGITTRYKILKDKRISVNKDKPIYSARFKVKPQIKNLRWEENKTFPAGQIWYFIFQAGGEIKVEIPDPASDTFFHYNDVEAMFKYEYSYTDA